MKGLNILAASVSALVLSACGGSDSSGGSTPASAYSGTWLSPVCEYGDYFPDTDTRTYERTVITINGESLVYEDNTYSDGTCSTVISSERDDLTITLGDTFTGADTGLTLQKVVISDGVDNYNYVAYATDKGNHLILTSNDDNTYSDRLTLDEYYLRQGGDFAPSGATTTVLNHYGINLTTGVAYTTEETHDVATIGWSPTYEYETGQGWGDGIWLRSNYESSDYSYVADMGLKTLDQVSSAPTSWPALDDFNTTADEAEAVSYIIKGHVYVVRMLNGNYAKIRVLNTPDADADNWQVLVEYELM